MHQNMKFPLFHVVLVEPEIPGNTGNIGRTCVGLNCCLHIVGEPAFQINDKMVRRAGLDYWPHLKWIQYESFSHFEKQVAQHIHRVFFLSTKAKKSVFDQTFQQGDYFVFGKETKGLGENVLKKYTQQTIGLPMFGPIRSHNLANTVTAVMYEATRQILISGQQ